MRARSQSYSDQSATNGNGASTVIIDCNIQHLYYGKFLAVRDSHLPVERGKITAFIGPSGCGKEYGLALPQSYE
jgi:phosphate transport system ATP-binding protein